MTGTLFDMPARTNRYLEPDRHTPRYRRADLETSQAAAAAVEPPAAELERAIVGLLRERGPLCDDEIVKALPSRYGPTVKSARSRLKNAGVVCASGERRRSARGKPMTVWQLVDMGGRL